MKVPKMYKSSDRYDAGTDVIYNDDSKLQYAPFIYAGVTAKDNGGGDDEEGEDTMLVIYDSVTGTIDKSFKELKDAVNSGKTVTLRVVLVDSEETFIEYLYYLVDLEKVIEENYKAIFASVTYTPPETKTTDVIVLEATEITDNMVREQGNG